MNRVIISDRIITEPVNMMAVVLREVEQVMNENEKPAEDIKTLKEKILAAGTISEIQAMVYEAVGDEIIIDA